MRELNSGAFKHDLSLTEARAGLCQVRLGSGERCLRLGYLLIEFRRVDQRQDLPVLHPIPNIYEEPLEVSVELGVDGDLLDSLNPPGKDKISRVGGVGGVTERGHVGVHGQGHVGVQGRGEADCPDDEHGRCPG